MEPSDEAKAAAEKEYYNIALTMANTRLAHDYKIEVLAQLLDDHTAALRAEVEALRAERESLKEWLEFKRTTTEKSIWRVLNAAEDTGYYDGALSAFGEVLERLSEQQ